MLVRVLALFIGLLAGSCGDGAYTPCGGACVRLGAFCRVCGGMERCSDAGEECQDTPENICSFCSGWQLHGTETCTVEGNQAVVRCE